MGSRTASATSEDLVESPWTIRLAKRGSRAYTPSSFSRATYSLPVSVATSHLSSYSPLAQLDNVLDSVDNLQSAARIDLRDTLCQSKLSRRRKMTYSPVCIQPSESIVFAVFSGSWRYPGVMLDPLMHSLTVNSERGLETGHSLSSRIRRVVTGVLSSATGESRPLTYAHLWHIDQSDVVAWLDLTAGTRRVDVPWDSDGQEVKPEVGRCLPFCTCSDSL